jgi:threonine/homoserine/homoserine lactone efflux protein
MPDLATLSVFLTAAFILSITPGPGIFYTLVRSLKGGKSEGILSAPGLFEGGLFHVVAAAVGISSLLMASAIAFTLVKYAGAGYLIYLGMRTLLQRENPSLNLDQIPKPRSRATIFYQGGDHRDFEPQDRSLFLGFYSPVH